TIPCRARRCSASACERKVRSAEGGREDLRGGAGWHIRSRISGDADASPAWRTVLQEVRQPEKRATAGTERAVSLERDDRNKSPRTTTRGLRRIRSEEASCGGLRRLDSRPENPYYHR